MFSNKQKMILIIHLN